MKIGDQRRGEKKGEGEKRRGEEESNILSDCVQNQPVADLSISGLFSLLFAVTHAR